MPFRHLAASLPAWRATLPCALHGPRFHRRHAAAQLHSCQAAAGLAAQLPLPGVVLLSVQVVKPAPAAPAPAAAAEAVDAAPHWHAPRPASEQPPPLPPHSAAASPLQVPAPHQGAASWTRSAAWPLPPAAASIAPAACPQLSPELQDLAGLCHRWAGTGMPPLVAHTRRLPVPCSIQEVEQAERAAGFAMMEGKASGRAPA